MKNINDVEQSLEADHLERIEIELLLEGVYRYYGYDFRNYSYSSIRRRIWHRIHAEKLKSISELQHRVLYDSNCLHRFYTDLLIHVTEMFRDPTFFLSFRRNVIPLLRTYPYFRIWHAGCATGEEVFSMAILLDEEGLLNRAKIYATDMNEDILEKAKQGIFPINKMQKYTNNYLHAGGKKAFSEYYTAKYDYVKFHSYLTDQVVFAQHNLVTDGSFNEFNVVLCRNVLIYFDQSLQERVHELFYSSLNTLGILGLGNKESIYFTKYADTYEEIDKHEKLYKKKY